MMTHLKLAIFGPLLAVLVATACSETSVPTSRIFSLPEDVQVHAQVECQAELGINHVDSIDVLRLKDGRSIVSSIDGRGLSLAQASAVNRCAQKRLLGEAHPVSYVREKPPHSIVRGDARQPYSTLNPNSCKEGRSVIQGGVAICPGL